MGLKSFPGDDAECGTGRILDFQFGRGRIVRPIEEEDPERAAEFATHRAALRKAVIAHVAEFTEFQPVTREEWNVFFEAVNRYIQPLFEPVGLFRNPTQEIMGAVIEGLKNAGREQNRVHVKRKPDGRMDIPGSLLVLQTHEGLRTLAELFYQKTGMNLLLLFLRQLEQGRPKVLYRLKAISNHGQDGWGLKLQHRPSGEITQLPVRPRQQTHQGMPPLACFVLLPEVPEEQEEDDPEGPESA